MADSRTVERLRRVAVLVVVLVAASSARGDDEGDREARLKRLGVDDDLRAKIHAAIDAGARWLAGRLALDGSLRGGRVDQPRQEAGRTALVALALAHARSPAADEAARRATKHLFEVDPTGRAALRAETYTAGLGGLLASEPACGVRHEDAKDLAEALADGELPSSGWWGYRLDRASPGRTPGRPVGERDLSGRRRAIAQDVEAIANLSTTQFAVLGLWGLARRGLVVRDEVWRLHLERLCAYQAKDGSWPYLPTAQAAGYPNGTFMGFAGLLVAEAALARRDLDVDLRRAVAVARVKGLEALRRDAARWFEPFEASPRSSAVPLDYYGLYALEKACVFADLETVGGRSWYVRGARLLLAAQDRDGGWAPTPGRASAGSAREIATAFAVLFLTRSAERYRPTTPSEPSSSPAGPSTPLTPSEPGRDPASGR